MPDNRESPKVFLSYSWTSDEHQEWVIDLAERLQNDGGNVIVDAWDLKAGHDKYAFMEQMVTDPSIKKVLMILDPRYAEKADKREGGVGSESQIISAELYGKVAQEKFVPVLSTLGQDGKACLPVYLSSRIYIDLSSRQNYSENYEKLLRNIYERPARQRPAIGQAPAFLNEPNPLPSTTKFKLEACIKTFESGSRDAQGHLRRFLTECLVSLELFRIQTKPQEPLDEAIVNRIVEMTPIRNQLLHAFDTVCTFTEDPNYYREFHTFLEGAASFLFRPPSMNAWSDEWFDNFRFFLRELFLYFTALLLKHRRYDQANILMRSDYSYATPDENGCGSFAIFGRHIASLDEFRKQRLSLHRISVVADMIKERAPAFGIDFDALMEADIILSLKYVMEDLGRGQFENWYPATAVFTERSFKVLKLFSPFASSRNSEAIGVLFGTPTPAAFRQKLEEAYSRHHLDRWLIGHIPIQFPRLTGVAELRSNR